MRCYRPFFPKPVRVTSHSQPDDGTVEDYLTKRRLKDEETRGVVALNIMPPQGEEEEIRGESRRFGT
jgi:hypothetical protein